MKRKAMRLLCLIPVWKRPEITRICYAGLRRLESKFLNLGVNFLPFIIYSEQEHGELAREMGFFSCYAENRPLGAKLNAGLSAAMELNWDYLMTLGSDDLVTNEGAEMIAQYMTEGVHFFGFDHIYFADTQEKRLMKHEAGHVFGAGRCISRDTIEKVCYHYEVTQLKGMAGPRVRYSAGQTYLVHRHGPNQVVTGERIVRLWAPERDSGLDSSSEETIANNAHRLPHIIRIAAPAVIDLKGPDNIHSFEKIQAMGGKLVPWRAVAPEMNHL